jgi:hypothetical protein
VGEFGGAIYTTSDVLAASSGTLLGSSPLFNLEDGYAYVDGTFFTWMNEGGGSDELVALRDITPPVVTPSTPAEGTATNSTQPTFSWTASDGNGPGLTELVFLLDGTPTDLSPSTTSYQAPGGLSEGNHTWQISATDSVGNVTTTPARTVCIDSIPPTVPAPQAPIANATVQRATPTLSWTESTATCGMEHYVLVIDGSPAANVPPSACHAGTCISTAPNGLSDGAHTWQIEAVDRAGNQSAGPAEAFTVAVPPSATISGPALALAGEAVTFNAGGSSDANSTINDHAWDFDGSNTFSQDAGAALTVTHTFQASGAYMVDLRIRDTAGLTAITHFTVDVRPAPPPGHVGLSINNGNYATNNPSVQLEAVWPPFAIQALVSNDGGFGAVGSTMTVPLTSQIPWTLEQTGPDRLPKTVYMRFLGAGIDLLTFTDDIILDEIPPGLQSASLIGDAPVGTEARTAAQVSRKHVKLHTYRVKIKARDAITGICAVNASRTRSGGVVTTITNCHRKGIAQLSKTVRLKAASSPLYVRVQNSAGTWSRWLKLKR